MLVPYIEARPMAMGNSKVNVRCRMPVQAARQKSDALYTTTGSAKARLSQPAKSLNHGPFTESRPR